MAGYALSILLTLVSTVALGASCESLFDPTTPTSVDWIRARNAETEAILKKSPNFTSVERVIRSSLPPFKIVKAMRLGPNRRLQLWRTGFARPDQLALIEDGKIEILDWSLTHIQNGTERIREIFPAPDGNSVALIVERGGTTDNFEIKVFDILNRQSLFGDMYTSKPLVTWRSSNEFFYQEHTLRSRQVRKVSLAERKWGYLKSHGTLFATKGDLALFSSATGWLLTDTAGLKLELPASLELSGIAGRIGRIIYLQSKSDNGGILKITVDSNGDAKVRTWVQSEEDRVLESVEVGQYTMTLYYRWGARQWLWVYNVETKKAFTVELPPNSAFMGSAWRNDSKVLDVFLESPVSKKRKFRFNATTNSWDRPAVKYDLYRDAAGVEFVSEVVDIVSADGTLVPTQITRRRDVTKNGKNPTLIRVYGGFGLSGYVNHGYELMVHEYLKNGGIVVSPIVRGGGEFGKKWHNAGRRENKMRTVEDVVAVARWMPQNRWTTPSLIDLMGSSNGGFVAAAAGLLSPESFGTIYAFAGVHEMLRRRDLDPLFNPAWIRDYGDEANVANDRIWLEAISPVELARKADVAKLPKFFILVGRGDSRVNPEHSYRLARTLLERGARPGSVLLYDIADAGHYVAGSTFENPVNWLANAAVYSLIFDDAKFRPESRH